MKTFLALLFAAGTLLAQKATFPTPNIQLFDNFGAPCAGCSLYTYAATTATPQNTYTTPAGSTANSSPIVLDSAGRANVWTTPGQSYRFDLYDASAAIIWSVDNIPGGSLIGTAAVTANYVYAGPTTGAAATPAFRALVAADLPSITPTVCTNQLLSQISAAFLGTCRSLAGADFGAAIAARSALGRNAATAGAPAFNTTQDALGYQVAEIPSSVFVAGDFTTSGVGTAFELITGLTWTIPASTALNVPFSCKLVYHQNVATDAVAFGIRDVTVSPTNILGHGVMYTNTTASTEGNLVALASTTATAIVSATPSAITTNWLATISGFIEAPSNASSSAIQIMVSTATAADTVTVKRGSFCTLN